MAKKKEETEKNEEILQRLELLFGKGTVVSASSIKHLNVKEWTSTGSLSLDLATKGGIPKGGLCTCILGKESSSKTIGKRMGYCGQTLCAKRWIIVKRMAWQDCYGNLH